MGIKDKFERISSNASSRTAETSEKSLQNPRAPRTAPGMAAAASRLFNEERAKLFNEIESLRSQLHEAKNNSATVSANEQEIANIKTRLHEKESSFGIQYIQVSDCHIKKQNQNTPRRKRQLTEKEFNNLRESIKASGMSLPISVEPRNEEEGGYWIVSGHNRHEVHVQEGIKEIRAEVLNPAEFDVEVTALLSNLLSPELSAHEFYRGISYLRNVAGKNLGEISKITGKAKSTLSEFFCMDRLPALVQNAMEDLNLKMGSSGVAELADLTNESNKDLAIEVLKKVSAGANWSSEKKVLFPDSATKSKNIANKLSVRRGDSDIATISVKKNTIGITLQSTEIPPKLIEKIKQLLIDDL